MRTVHLQAWLIESRIDSTQNMFFPKSFKHPTIPRFTHELYATTNQNVHNHRLRYKTDNTTFLHIIVCTISRWCTCALTQIKPCIDWLVGYLRPFRDIFIHQNISTSNSSNIKYKVQFIDFSIHRVKFPRLSKSICWTKQSI